MSLEKTKPGTAVPFRASTVKAKDPAVVAARNAALRSAKPVQWPTDADTAVRFVPKAKNSVSAASDTATVKVAAHSAATAAGVDGALLSFTRPAGTGAAQISLDYSGFADAYGGDFASRLTLVEMPACALTSPEKAECRTRTPLAAHNDLTGRTLSVSVPAVAPATKGDASSTRLTVLGVTSTAKSGAGSYQATALAPSGSWNAGGSSGDFSWSYPMQVPPAAAGPAPNLALGYDSQSVDGRLPSTNNQPSWVGEGWDLPTSYIERSYDSCDDDGQDKKYDECWANDNATLVLNGKSTPLIKDKNTGEWHPKEDDGERVIHWTGAVNGDNDGEYWTVTTPDGSQYTFGLNRLPGWSTGKAETNSTWTVPVYGDDSSEPGYTGGTSFSGRSLTQAWRWNLDYVVDTHQNAMSYWYSKENNAYGQNGTTTATGTTYVRGGYLSRIDYGITASTVFGTAPDQVVFSTRERCLPTDTEPCGTLSPTTAKDWPDVPFDQICNLGTVCKNTPSPTFFSRRRLVGVTAKVWDASLTTPAYRDVDAWTLDQNFVDPGDGTSASLWLKSITRTGKDGADLAMKPITFAGIQLANRVDTTHDDIAALIKWRVRTITTETGSVITVNYSDPQCIVGTNMPSAPDSNTKLCYPVWWTPPLTAKPQLDWFHKYVVKQVNESDPSGGAPLKETDYTYNGNPAWHYDSDDVISPASRKTWSVWRGYGSVTTTTGDAQSARTKTVATFFRGMDGDKQSDGTTRSVKVTDSNGTQVTDSDELAGDVRESVTYNGAAEVSGTITDEWIHQTATDGTRIATFVRPAAVHNRTDIVGGSPRTTTSITTYDAATGEPTEVNDLGDDAVSGDEQCTRTTYVNNVDAWIMAAPIRVETVDVSCGTTPSRPDNVVSDARTLYDYASYGTAPTHGEETSTQRLTSYNGSTPVYQTVSNSTYDTQGRVLTVKDAAGHTSSTAYTPSSGGPLTQTVTKDAKDYATTTTYDPARGVATSVVDPNSKRTDYAYDPLGRVTGIWLANRNKSAGQQPNLTYTYALSNSAASYVRTGKVRNDGTSYDYTYAIYDSMLRPRQSQTPAPGGGRVISETKYDSRGLAVETDADYTDGSTASGTLANITSVEPAQTLTTYDGASRPTAADFYAKGTKKWTTSTSYGGDRTTVIPPNGGVATTTLTDTLGRTTETRQYDNGTASGPYTSITYGYDAKSRLTKVTDAGNNVWTYGYDVMGRQVTATDPDAGATRTAYNDLDQMVATTDSRGKTISYTYDELGRKTGMFDSAVADQSSDNQLAKWTYDSVSKGQPTSSIRYVKDSTTGATLSYTSQVGAYDELYRPTATRVVIPSATGEGALAGSYVSNATYNLDGTLYSTSDPAAGGLPSESLVYGYNELGMPKNLNGASGYVQNTQYTKLSQVQQITLGESSNSATKWVQETNTYEDGTGRLNRQLITDDTHTAPVDDTHYSYDDAGNPTVVDATDDTGDDTQCYRYDGHDRLTQAWTATNGCASDPTTGILGGPAPYWQTYSYDKLGNRTQLVQHGTNTGAPDATTTYTYGAEDGSQPHTLTSSKTVEAGKPDKQNAYGYDKSGNTTNRTLDGTSESLQWDDEGDLAQADDSDGTSASYLYDADGERLLSRDASGTTLYLGDTELKLLKGTTSTNGTRYYSWGDQTVATRSGDGSLEWVLTDAHNTATTQIDADTQTAVHRRTDPFGNSRGSDPDSWTGDQGFVGGVEDDTTGLTHLGARDYDPTIGRFISLDPVLELTDPQQINGYSYASSNPVTGSDPSGLMNAAVGGGGYCDDSCQKDIAALDKQHSEQGAGTPKKKHCSFWNVKCGAKAVVHKVKHVVEQHPVIAAVVATAVVVSAVACVVGTGGACAAVLVAAAEGVTAGAEFGATAAVVSGATSAVVAGGATVAAEVATASVAAATVTKAVETAAKEDAAASAGADTAAAGAKAKADSGSASGGERAADAAPQTGAACSFVPSTPVLMANGKSKPIGDIAVGDKVKTADPDTGKNDGSHAVTATWVNHDDDLVDLTIKVPGAKPATVHTTSKHPFWDDTTHTWVPAGTLKPGHALNTDHDQHVTVIAVRITAGAANRDNLTVSDVHTYYVLAGTTPVLVHNCNGEVAQQLASRSSDIHSQAGSPIAMSKSTVSVIRARTPHGTVDVVAGSGRGLTKAQREMIGKGEILADNIAGMHAEQNALLYINKMGWEPIAGGASRSVCNTYCAPLIRATGGRMTGQTYQSESGTMVRTFVW
ncbi:RHS repeat-associated core domain-containing protein [Actinacidiphila alni]|uniref:RHS repeat-associated core domain-containing protein n=1 Tax=Actinacidiphila alni TaxID=380248 RepID=UPI0015A6D505|nr:RHS repeat-associated core domain-containing protein [Actinacidiphila alni]